MKKRESNFLTVQTVMGQQGIVLNEKRGGLDAVLETRVFEFSEQGEEKKSSPGCPGISWDQQEDDFHCLR